MGQTQKTSGDTHTKQVSLYLKHLIQNSSSNPSTNDPSWMTAHFLFTQFPGLTDVQSKFEFSNFDHRADLYLYQNDRIIPIHLFSLKKTGSIQPKNPGAKSFLDKYFNLPEAQIQLNSIIDQERERLYRYILDQKNLPHLYLSERDLKKQVSLLQLTQLESKQYRKMILESIRDQCYSILLKLLNTNHTLIFNGFKELSLIEEYKVLSIQDINKSIHVEMQQQTLKSFHNIYLLKKNTSSIYIYIDDFELELRFKFESSLSSSIKLATKLSSSIHLTEQLPQQFESINNQFLNIFEDILNNHTYVPASNNSNAIGRCNEALLIYRFIKKNPSINIVDAEIIHSTFEKHYGNLNSEMLEQLITCSETTYHSLSVFLKERFGEFYTIQQVQLVADSYVSNKLETADVIFTINHKNTYIEIPLSLKALKKRNSMMTLKNPGVGSILSYHYFDIYDDMQLYIARIKEKYQSDLLTRKEVLSIVSHKITEHLKKASQTSLESGLRNMIGTNTSVISFYQQNMCSIHSYLQVKGPVEVQQTSSTTTRLSWMSGQEEIRLRVKFSSGASHGWSSLKLSCERLIK